MSTASKAPPTGFSIAVPPSWFEVDVHPDTRNSSINRLVIDRTRAVPELFAHKAALVRALRAAARTAHGRGAVYCGVMVEGFESALLTASVTVSVVTAPPDADGVLEHLRPIARSGPDSTWRDVLYADLPHAGRVARTVGVEDVTMPDGAGWLRTVLTQTFVPMPGTDRVVIITASSPILPLAEELHQLFDAISSTFQFLPAG